MEKNYDIYTNNKDIVVAVSFYRGKRYRAEAKCCPEDTFDLNVGKKIATSRVDREIAEDKRRIALNELVEIDKLRMELDARRKSAENFYWNANHELAKALKEERETINDINKNN